MHVHALSIHFRPLLQSLSALFLSLWLIDQIRHAYLSDSGVCLCDVALNFCFRSDCLEWVLEALVGLGDTGLKCLNSLDSVVYLTQLKVSFIGAIGVLLDRLFQNLLRLLPLIILLQHIGIAHDNSLIKWTPLISQFIKVLGLIVVELLLLLFGHLEQLLKREALYWFALLFVHFFGVWDCCKDEGI